MTQEEKAKRIALDKQSGKASGYIDTFLTAYESAMEMAEWKDSQLKHYLETCLEKAQKRALDKLVITLESMIEELGL